MKKIFISAALFALAPSFAYSADDSQSNFQAQLVAPKTSVTLPTDLTQWNDATFNFLKPVMASPAVEEKVRELLDFTMPKHGQFDPIDVKRREQTLAMTYDKLVGKSESDQISMFVGLLERHKKYLSH